MLRHICGFFFFFFKFICSLTRSLRLTPALQQKFGSKSIGEKTKSCADIFLTVAAAFGLLRNLLYLIQLTVLPVIRVISPPCPSPWKMSCLTLGCISVYFQSIHILERTSSSSTEPSISRQLLEPEPVPLSKVSGWRRCSLRWQDACLGLVELELLHLTPLR